MKRTNITTGMIAGAIVALLAYMALHVRPATAATAVAVLKTSGMTCRSCAEKITSTLKTVKGVAHTEVDLAGGFVVVGFDAAKATPEALAVQVGTTGYHSTVEQVLTPDQFRQMTGRDIGRMAAARGSCCGPDSGCSNSAATGRAQ